MGDVRTLLGSGRRNSLALLGRRSKSLAMRSKNSPVGDTEDELPGPRYENVRRRPKSGPPRGLPSMYSSASRRRLSSLSLKMAMSSASRLRIK